MGQEKLMGLQTVTNLFRATVDFKNKENSTHDKTVDTNKTKSLGNAWIPYAGTKKEFNDRRMSIIGAGVTYYIWDHDYNARYRTTEVSDAHPFVAAGTKISGNSHGAGSKALTVLTDGTLVMTDYS